MTLQDRRIREGKAISILIRALQWYANPKNWEEDDWGIKAVVHPPDYGDPGSKARKALSRWGYLMDPLQKGDPT